MRLHRLVPYCTLPSLTLDRMSGCLRMCLPGRLAPAWLPIIGISAASSAKTTPLENAGS